MDRLGPSRESLRILIVEDEFLLAMALEDALSACGCEAVGPVGRVDAALSLARTESLDGAILDVNVHGLNTYQVAAELQLRGVPFVFSTGYERLEAPFSNTRMLKKPFNNEQLRAIIHSVFRTEGED